jgi:hypothetical protein
MRCDPGRNKQKLVNGKELCDFSGDLQMAGVDRIKRSTVDRNTLSDRSYSLSSYNANSTTSGVSRNLLISSSFAAIAATNSAVPLLVTDEIA